MGSETSSPTTDSTGTTIVYLIQVEGFSWLKSDYVTAFWIVWSIFFGLFSFGVFYSFYYILLEIIMIFPVNYWEFLFGDVDYTDLIWPTRLDNTSVVIDV